MILMIYAIFLIINILTIKTKYHIIFKTLNSFAFLGVAIYSAIMSDNILLLYAMLPGFLFCVLGDFLLATTYKKSFTYGLLSFLIGNLCFVYYFTNFKAISIIELIIPILSIISAICFSYLPKMDYKKLDKFIYAYSFVITLAMIRSVVVYITFPTTMFLYSMIGFILYFLSDFVLLFSRFYEHDSKYFQGVNLLLYYSGLFMIASSLI